MLRLKEVRLKKGFSVPQLVELSGVSRRTIQEAENRKDCRMSTACKLSRALGVSLDELWQPEEQ